MFDRIAFVIGEALQNLRRHGFMTFSAVAVVAISLALIGGLVLTYKSALDFAERVPGQFSMNIVLRDGASSKDITETAAAIRKFRGVATVNWIPRDKAWARLKQQQPKMTEGIDNPLPDAFKVTLSTLERTDEIANEIRQLPAVDPSDGVKYMSVEQNVVQGWIRFIQWLGSIGILLFIIAGILIYNTIRLAAIARRTEVRIMRLVGASRATVAIPFLLEGLLQGAVGGALSAMFVWGGWRILTDTLAKTKNVTEMQAVVSPDMAATPVFPLALIVGSLTALGAIYGVICSLIALRIRPEMR